RHSLPLARGSQRTDLPLAQRAAEDGDIVHQADVIHAEPDGAFGYIPLEWLGDFRSRALELAIQVQLGLTRAATQSRVSDGDVGPAAPRERSAIHYHQPIVEVRVLLIGGVGRVPRLERAEDAEAEMAGLVVFGEIDPDGRVVIGFVGDLD